ncbi:MAG: YciI family protein [Alphaproteobacteria bacterium]
MLYAIICRDGPDGLALRKANRAAHLEFLEDQGSRVIAAGPFRDENTGEPTGSLLIIRAESLADAHSFAALDPYARAGVFANVEVRPWSWLINRPDDIEE